MAEYIQLVGTDVPGAVGSCCLVTDDRRVLFNCPEGSQRAMSEGRLRIGKVSTFLFTRVEVSSTMGLPGFLFSINDCGVKQCCVGGPLRELLRLLATTWRCFFGYRQLLCEVPNYFAASDSTPADRPSPVRVEGGFRLSSSKHRLPSPAESPSIAVTPQKAFAETVADKVEESVVQNLLCNPEEWYHTPGTLLFRLAVGTVDVVAFFAGMTAPTPIRDDATPIVGYALLERRKVVFDAVKAKGLGVKPGPKFAQLKNGVDVFSDTQPPILVKASDVVQENAGATFSLILDTDDPRALEISLRGLMASSLFSASHGPMLQHIAHLGPPSVVTSAVYQTSIASTDWWRATFPGVFPPEPSTLGEKLGVGNVCVEHACSSSCRGYTGFPTALVHRMHLNGLAPPFFPFPPCYHQSELSAHNAEQKLWPYAARYRLGTATKKNASPLPDELVVRYPDEGMAMSMLSASFRSAYLREKAPCCTASREAAFTTDSRHAGDVTFLGTGSSIPSKYRNVSGIVVKMPRRDVDTHDTRVVLDCGEGTVGQLFAQCCFPCGGSTVGRRDFAEIMSSIEMVFISHSHADHNLGLFSLLEHIIRARTATKRQEVFASPLVIVAPADFLKFFRDFSLVDVDKLQREDGLQLDSFSSRGPMLARCPVRDGAVSHHEAPTTSPGVPPQALTSLCHLPAMLAWCTSRGYTGDVFPVDHPAHAHGIVLKKQNGTDVLSHAFAVLYSGDTRPNELLVQRGRQFGPLDILIHEATFDDSLAAEAAHKSHSTTGEAIDVARRCNAKNVLLTHFSQRYPKLPPPSASTPTVRAGGDPRVVFAFDFMRIPFNDERLSELAAMTPAFFALLAEYDSWESGTSKRLREEL